MKKIILCCLIIFSTIISIYSQSSWIQLNSGTSRYLIDMYFVNPNTGYVVGENGTILKTTNGGINWLSQVSGTTYTLFSVFFTDSSTGYIAGTYYGGLKTTNGGNNWFSMPYGQSPSYQICFLNSQTGYSVGAGNQVVKTTNAGLNWIFKNLNSTASFYSLYFLNPDTGFVGDGIGEVFKTINGGDNWVIYNPGIGSFSANSLYFINYNTGFASGYSGIGARTKKTTNSGINWFYPTTNQSQGFWSFDFLNSSTGYALGSRNDTTYYMYYTKNTGSTWDIIYADTSYTNYLSCVKFTNNYTGYAIGWDGIILKTTNGGFPSFVFGVTDTNTTTPLFYWSRVPNVASYRFQLSTDPSFNFVLLNALVTDTIYRAPGLGWACYYARVRADSSAWSNILYFCLHPRIISGTIYYQDNNQPVTQGYVKALKYDRSSDQIITMDSTGIQSNGTYSLSHVPQDSIYIMAYDDDETRPMYVPTYYPSTTSWQNATVLYPTGNLTNINVLVYRVNLSLGVNHIGGGVFSSSSTLTGLNNAIVYAKIGNVYKGFGISGNSGSYRIDSLSSGSYTVVCDRLGYTSGTNNISLSNFNQDTVNFYLQKIIGIKGPGDPVIPSSYKLFQNYPNPFNPITKIKFSISKATVGQTFLSVYDILGREVATLVNEKLSPGTYEVLWDGSNYSSGVYFYKLTVGDFMETKKLVLMK